MEPRRLLERKLAQLRARVRWVRAVRWALVFGLAAALPCLIWAAVSRAAFLYLPWFLPAGVVALALVAGITYALASRLTPLQVARAAEQRLNLKERLSTAWEVSAAGRSEGVASLLVSDAAERAADVRPAQVFRPRIARQGGVLALTLGLMAALLVLPEVPLLQSPARRQEQQAMRKEGEQLEKVAKEWAQRAKEAEAAKLKVVALRMEKLARAMRTGKVTQKRALVGLNELKRQLGELERESQAQVRKSDLQAQEELLAARLELAAKTAEEMQAEALKRGKTQDAEALSSLAKELSQKASQAKEKAASAAKPGQAPPRPGPPGMPIDDRTAELLRQLKQMQDQYGQYLNLDPDTAAKLAELFAKKDYQEALKKLEELAKKLGLEAKAGKLTEQQLKDLAEQMKKLAEALKGTDLDDLARQLLEMAKMLERMDPEEAKKLLEKMCKNGACIGLMGLQSLSAACKNAGAGLGRGSGPKGGGPGGTGWGENREVPGAGGAQQGQGGDRGGLRPPPTPEVKDGGAGPGERVTSEPSRGGQPTKLPGQVAEEGLTVSVPTQGAPEGSPPSSVPYYQVYEEYHRAAESALQREEVPPAYREQVRGYFESLQPK